MYPFFFFSDPTWIILIPGLIFALIAQGMVQSAFQRYSKIRASSGMTAAEVARAILDRSGLHDVKIERTHGTLTDHYDPRTKTLRLSDSVYTSYSLAALGVAAHEAGHALQHATNYVAMNIRQNLVPIAGIGSNLAVPLFFLGVVLGGLQGFGLGVLLMDIGIYLFLGIVIFHIVTLPVEFNASARALSILGDGGYLTREETGHAKKVLDAAAMTYLAATLMAILNLVRLFSIRSRRND